MTSSHDIIRDDLAAYALGALNSAAAQAIEQHVEHCEECRRILLEYEEVLRLLPFGLPVAVPSRGARAALIERVRSAGDRRRRTGGAWRWLLRYRYPAVALLTILVLLLTVSVGRILQHADTNGPVEFVTALSDHPEAQIIPMLGSAPAPDAIGQLILQPGESRAGLIASGLPELPPGWAYQFWSVGPGGTYISGGVFRTDDRGEAVVVVEAPRSFGPGWGCSVTIEPVDGSLTPSGQNVLLGWYPDSWLDNDSTGLSR